MRTKTTRLSVLAACMGLALVLSLGVAACGSSDDDTTGESTSAESGEGGGAIVSNPDNGKVSLTIGSKNFPESEITGEIYAQALAAAGYKVKTDLSLGSETIALKTLKAGQISGYPEYTSTALESLFGLEPEEVPADAEAAYEKAKAEFEKEGLTAFPPTPFSSANAVGTTEEDGRRTGPEDGLRPRRPVRRPDPLRLARVPPADRLPGRARTVLRAQVQVVQAGRHRPPLHGPRKGPGRPLDPLHHRPAAVGGERQVRDPRRRQGSLPGRQRHLRDRPGGRRRSGAGLRKDDRPGPGRADAAGHAGAQRPGRTRKRDGEGRSPANT